MEFTERGPKAERFLNKFCMKCPLELCTEV
jgi:hypothetical protein